MNYRFRALLTLLVLLCCMFETQAQVQSNLIDKTGKTIKDRISVPNSFFRTPLPSSSYQAYLQNLKLESADTKVMKYDGYEKTFNCYVAVLKMELENENIMHGEHYMQYLRAKFLFNSSKYDMIEFNYDDSRSITFAEWAAGGRFVQYPSGYVIDTIATPNDSEESFDKYMLEVYKHSSTGGLTMDTRLLEMSELSIGDLFIQPTGKGSDGHAVMIIDMAVRPGTGEKLVLLAQGFNPAQDMHILANPYDPSISPWYRVEDDEDELYFATAQWTFRKKHVRRFQINANANNLEASLVIGDE